MNLGVDAMEKLTTADFKLICEAARNGYPVGAEHRQQMVDIMQEVMNDKTKSSRERWRAVNALARLDAMNKQMQLKMIEISATEAAKSPEGIDRPPSAVVIDAMDDTIPLAG